MSTSRKSFGSTAAKIRWSLPGRKSIRAVKRKSSATPTFLWTPPKIELDDSADVISLDPSYRNFKVPLEILARERYVASRNKYEAQFQHEINQLIEYQASALEASYLVRMMSYTTFWPPLHNERELERLSRDFFQLTPKEKTRLRTIMSNDYQ